MLELAVLGSGSSGNSAVVRSGSTRVLVDAGLSARQLCLRLAAVGIDPDSLDAIIVTHEHGDHVQGLEVFCKTRPLPVYGTLHTCALLREKSRAPISWRPFEAGNAFRIGDIEIESFSVPHDAVDPVGYLFYNEVCRIGLLSDVGHVTRPIIDRLAGVHTLFTESNYDEVMLQNDTVRPWATKQRIANRHGHLSNEQAAALVAAVASPSLHRVVLGHLSSDCNTAELACSVVEARLRASGYEGVRVECAGRREPLPLAPGAPRAAESAAESVPMKSLRVREDGAQAEVKVPDSTNDCTQMEWAF